MTNYKHTEASEARWERNTSNINGKSAKEQEDEERALQGAAIQRIYLGFQATSNQAIWLVHSYAHHLTPELQVEH